jgi:L-alanine-DL-glutamate epimerase-like enolase superfamily enzyme
MKITKVEPFRVGWEWGDAAWKRRSAWVRITVEDGTYGIGEASPMEDGNASLELIHRPLTSVLIGADALDTAVLRERMYHRAIKTGPDGTLSAALAAVDIALWDLKGKLLNQPIYKLLGGAWTTQIPWYASIGNHASRSVDDTLRNLDEWLKFEPAMVKIRFDGDRTTRDLDLAGDIAKARAVRKHVGENFPLAFDANNNYSVQGAIRVGRVLEELGYEWFEEPVQHYHVKAFEKVANALDIAIAAGEQEYTLQGIGRLIEAGVEIIQPDIVKTGGFTGLMEMAALAKNYGVDVVPHQTQPSIGHAANLHFLAALPHRHYPAEFNERPHAGGVGVQDVVFEEPLRPRGGVFHLSTKPGLGLQLKEDELHKRITLWNDRK